MNTFALKVTLVPVLLLGASLASRRWGPGVGGMLAGLPITGGPILVFLACDQGMPFARHAAIGGLVGTVSFAVFCLVYGWVGRCWTWSATLPVALLAYALALVPLRGFHPPAVLALALAVVVLLGVRVALPRLPPAPRSPAGQGELALRMAAGVVVVVGVTGMARLVGPQVSGLLTTFPTAATVLGAASHRSDSIGATIAVLRGLCLGMLSYLAFMAVWALGPAWGLGTTLAVGILVALISHALLLLALRGRVG